MIELALDMLARRLTDSINEVYYKQQALHLLTNVAVKKHDKANKSPTTIDFVLYKFRRILSSKTRNLIRTKLLFAIGSYVTLSFEKITI